MNLTNKELANGLDVPRSRISEWIKRGMPTSSLEEAGRWRNVHARARGKKGEPSPSLAPQLIPRGESSQEPLSADYEWDARLHRAREMELEIYTSLRRALDKSDLLVVAKLQAAHLASIKEIASAEATALEIRKASGDLIHKDTVRAIWKECVSPIKSRLESLPVQERSRCNPDNPEIAYQALKEWVHRTLIIASTSETKFK